MSGAPVTAPSAPDESVPRSASPAPSESSSAPPGDASEASARRGLWRDVSSVPPKQSTLPPSLQEASKQAEVVDSGWDDEAPEPEPQPSAPPPAEQAAASPQRKAPATEAKREAPKAGAGKDEMPAASSAVTATAAEAVEAAPGEHRGEPNEIPAPTPSGRVPESGPLQRASDAEPATDQEERRGLPGTIWLVLLAAVAIAWWLWSRTNDSESSEVPPEPAVAAPAQLPVPEEPRVPPAKTDQQSDPAPEPVEVPGAQATAAPAQPSVPEQTDEATNDADADADAGGTRKVLLRVRPDGASVYRAGKKLGVSPLEVELKPREKMTLEVFLEGYHLRRVVIDGSEPVVVAGLIQKKPQPKVRPLPPSTAPRATASAIPAPDPS